MNLHHVHFHSQPPRGNTTVVITIQAKVAIGVKRTQLAEKWGICSSNMLPGGSCWHDGVYVLQETDLVTGGSVVTVWVMMYFQGCPADQTCAGVSGQCSCKTVSPTSSPTTGVPTTASPTTATPTGTPTPPTKAPTNAPTPPTKAPTRAPSYAPTPYYRVESLEECKARWYPSVMNSSVAATGLPYAMSCRTAFGEAGSAVESDSRVVLSPTAVEKGSGTAVGESLYLEAGVAGDAASQYPMHSSGHNVWVDHLPMREW